MAVASLVLEFGGSEDEAIAALLHDVLEDGGAGRAPEIEAKFGSAVLAIVRECSDSEPKAGEAKPPWKERKQAYVDSLPKKSGSALLVTACDKLHNLTAIVRDYRNLGDAVWDRFNSNLDDNVWYYSEMINGLNRLGVPPAKDLSVKFAEFCGILKDAK
jgi:(p)ppGpp synthase/HD superfamily hydrolase